MLNVESLFKTFHKSAENTLMLEMRVEQLCVTAPPTNIGMNVWVLGSGRISLGAIRKP